MPSALYAGTEQNRYSVEPSVVPPAQISEPIPATPRSWPFASTAHSVTPLNLEQQGYVEEEYFISGTARVFDWPALGELESFASGPYVTRIIIRRPSSEGRFSGTVIVEPLNPSLRVDAPVIWMEAQNHIMARGHAYVGITIKPVTIASLKRFDPERYASLSMANPLKPESTCPQSELAPPRGGLPPESSPETENGLIWDIISQTAALLRADSPSNPLGAGSVSKVYLAGDSQSGAFTLLYANAIHPFVLRPDGGPVFDGYLSLAAQGPGVPINQCDPGLNKSDPRMVIQPRGVPIIKIVTQSDIVSTHRRPDSDTYPDLYRGYEVAGASHIDGWVVNWGAAAEDVARASGINFLNNEGCAQHKEQPNELPLQFVVSAAVENMESWTRRGVAPPKAEPLQISDLDNARATLALDSNGNPAGGLRLPEINVPRHRYAAFMDGPGICEVWGYQVPLEPSVLAALYSSDEEYLRQFKAAVKQARADRWLTPEDAAQAIATTQQRLTSDASAAKAIGSDD